jgi:hypothetical protein
MRPIKPEQTWYDKLLNLVTRNRTSPADPIERAVESFPTTQPSNASMSHLADLAQTVSRADARRYLEQALRDHAACPCSRDRLIKAAAFAGFLELYAGEPTPPSPQKNAELAVTAYAIASSTWAEVYG